MLVWDIVEHYRENAAEACNDQPIGFCLCLIPKIRDLVFAVLRFQIAVAEQRDCNAGATHGLFDHGVEHLRETQSLIPPDIDLLAEAFVEAHYERTLELFDPALLSFPIRKVVGMSVGQEDVWRGPLKSHRVDETLFAESAILPIEAPKGHVRHMAQATNPFFPVQGPARRRRSATCCDHIFDISKP